MSGQLGTQFRGLILENKEELLFQNNVSPKGPVETNVPTNDLSSQTINIGYSILSETPARINKAIQTGKYNVKKVLLTKSYDCTLRGELTNGHIHSWKTSEDVLPFKKIIYSGTKPGHISNNFDLWNRQLEVMNKIITRWASTTSYSGAFASSLVSLNMGDYDIVFNDPSDPDNITKYKFNTCEELLRVLKAETGLPLVYIPKYEATSCFHMPWTSFNKRTLLDLMISVNGINNSPVAKSQYGDGFISTLCEDPPNATPNANEGAFTAFETKNSTASNYIRVMNNVFVDAFEPIDDVPTLLQLVFSTDFFFELKPEDEEQDEPTDEPTDDCGHASPPRYNPNTMVSSPLEASH